jgi:hypothetical protein
MMTLQQKGEKEKFPTTTTEEKEREREKADNGNDRNRCQGYCSLSLNNWCSSPNMTKNDVLTFTKTQQKNDSLQHVFKVHRESPKIEDEA